MGAAVTILGGGHAEYAAVWAHPFACRLSRVIDCWRRIGWRSLPGRGLASLQLGGFIDLLVEPNNRFWRGVIDKQDGLSGGGDGGNLYA